MRIGRQAIDDAVVVAAVTEWRVKMAALLRSVLLCVGLCLVGSLSAEAQAAKSQPAESPPLESQPTKPSSAESQPAGASPQSKGLKPLEADYVVFYGRAKIADASVNLSPKKRRMWLNQIRVIPVGVASWFVKETVARSEFRVFDDRIYLSSVEYERGDSIYEGYWLNNEMRALYKGRSFFLEAPTGVLDKLTMVLQAALSADAMPEGSSRRLLVVGRGEVREYEMWFEARERIKTDLGEFDARVVSVRRHDEPRYRYWFSGEHAHLPVQVARLKGADGDIVWTATLHRLHLH